jgi:hypothetical protein
MVIDGPVGRSARPADGFYPACFFRTNVSLAYCGRPIGAYTSTAGRFEFFVAPGTYTLNAYGSELRDKDVTVTIPEGESEFTVKPVALTASRLLLPQGDRPQSWKGSSLGRGRR